MSGKSKQIQINDYLVNLDNFSPVEHIGSGSYSNVEKVVDKKTSKQYAIKTFIKNDDENIQKEETVQKLIRTLVQFDHSTIIKFIGFSNRDIRGNKSSSIIMQYAENGSLDGFLYNTYKSCELNDTNRQIILIGIARSMMLFDKYNITIGNLNPENVLLDENLCPHVTDFYNSILFPNNNLPFKPIYASPEVIKGHNSSEKSDVYSFGMIMYGIVTRLIPFNEIQKKKVSLYTMLNKIANGLRPAIPEDINPYFKELIENCWSQNPSQRPSFEKIYFLLAYDEKYRLKNVDYEKVVEYIEMVKKDLVFCTVCERQIEKKELVYYSGFPYHYRCVSCMNCHKTLGENGSKIENFISITPGLFLCENHYDEYITTQMMSPQLLTEYNDVLVKNMVKELFNQPVSISDNITDYKPDEIFIDSDMIQDSFQVDKPYDQFLPSATFHFQFSPQQIDFNMLKEILGDDLIIIQIAKGSTILRVAFLATDKLHQIEKTYQSIISPIKENLNSAIGKPIIGNLVKEPLINIPSDDKIKEFYNKKSINILQNTKTLEKIKLDEIKAEVNNALSKESIYKNLQHIFQHIEMFEKAEEEVRNDIKDNPYEMIIIGQTIIANKYFDEYNDIKKKIPENDVVEIFLYHGSRLKNHQKIVQEHFLMPGEDYIAVENITDDGYYGKGIYATKNMFYASLYGNGYHVLKFNEKTSIICCKAIYNSVFVNELTDLSCRGKHISEDVALNYGINHVFVGSSTKFHPIKQSDIKKNLIVADEYVFPYKYQIVPICSFTVMRSEYCIIWKDEHIKNNENTKYMKALSKKIQVNVYFKSDVDEAIQLVELKKRNKIKLITNGGKDLTGKKFIEEARNIIRSNFVCLVFAKDVHHLDWVTKMENVLFTNEAAYFKKFAEIDMKKEVIITYIQELEHKYNVKFNINEKSLLSFPLVKI